MPKIRLELDQDLINRIIAVVSLHPGGEEMMRPLVQASVEHALGQFNELDLMYLLAKFASGEGGQRTGELMRRGLVHIEVTDAGRAKLVQVGMYKPSPVPEGEIKCTICTQVLGMNEAIIGDGDGTGRRFAHASCYRRREAGLPPKAKERCSDTVPPPDRGDGICPLCGFAVEDH